MLRVQYGQIGDLPDRCGKLPLSEYRRKQVSGCLSELRRRQGIGAELLLLSMLESWRGLPELPLPLLADEKGKPYLPGESLFFSLSHSGEYAACALSDKPVGLDLQMRRPLREQVLTRCFSPAEQRFVRSSPRPDDDFTELWTAKESYLKATGEGIRLSLSDLDMLSPPHEASFWHGCRDGFHLSVCVLGENAVPERAEKVDLADFLLSLR